MSLPWVESIATPTIIDMGGFKTEVRPTIATMKRLPALRKKRILKVAARKDIRRLRQTGVTHGRKSNVMRGLPFDVLNCTFSLGKEEEKEINKHDERYPGQCARVVSSPRTYHRAHLGRGCSSIGSLVRFLQAKQQTEFGHRKLHC